MLDLGDIVEATGEVMKTERGEISVQVDSLRLLSKAIRPLPDQWSGLKDREQVLRKRYLDTILEPASFERFGAISRMVEAVRAFLNGRGFMEFQTPVIQPQYGGGTAKPFKTHVNALGCEMYLAISHELYLKRLIVAGFDKVYTIGRYFRNEGIDRSHHPEFSMVETMAAYENYEYNMNLIEEMFREVGSEGVWADGVQGARAHDRFQQTVAAGEHGGGGAGKNGRGFPGVPHGGGGEREIGGVGHPRTAAERRGRRW